MAVAGLERGMNQPTALGLDFVATRRRTSPIGWLLLVAGAVLMGIVALDWQATRADAAHWSAKTEHWQSLARRFGGSKMTDDDATALRPQVVAATKAVRRLATPWGALYRSLEGSLDDTVSLLSISPNVDKGEVRLNGEAKDFAALRHYLRRLSESEALYDVRLLSQEVKRNDAQHPIVFSVVTAWRQAS
jgi:Tfp pilus assembly protein PilN